MLQRDVFDALSKKLIASEEVTDENRDDRGKWHAKLPEPVPGVTHTVLLYKEPLSEKKGESPNSRGRIVWAAEGL